MARQAGLHQELESGLDMEAFPPGRMRVALRGRARLWSGGGGG